MNNGSTIRIASALMMLTCVSLQAPAGWAVGVEPPSASTPDRLERLYQPGLKATQKGEPYLLVRLVHRVTGVTIKSDSPLRFRLGAQEPAEIIVPAATAWTIGLDRVAEGQSRHWVAAERFSGHDAERASLARSRWVGRGYAVRVIENGSLLRLGNYEFDSRQFTVAVAPELIQGKAKNRALRLKRSRQVIGKVIEQVIERPSATITARHPTTGEQLRAPRLLTVEPVDPDGIIEIGGVRWPLRGTEPRRFEGELLFLMGTDGKLMVLNRVLAETLVAGVVASEIYPRAPGQTLRAQAVLARGFLLNKFRNRHGGAPYDLCAESHCQAYHGVGPRTAHTDAAVRATRGEVMLFSNVLIDTVYHSACGGHTEAYHRMWGGEQSRVMGGVRDGGSGPPKVDTAQIAQFIRKPPAGVWCRASAERSGVFRWKVRRTGAAITRSINARQKIGEVHGIEVLERGRSGRAITVLYRGQRGTHTVRGATANRRLLGGLASGLWIVSREGGALDRAPPHWVFEGGGYGHGVGMCQHGAIGMAKAGKSYRQILRHYYQNGRIEALW